MKKAIIILLLTSPLIGMTQISSYTRELDTLKYVELGSRNESGEKQGNWEYYRIEEYLKIFDNGFIDTIIEKEKICEGEYAKDKRIGEWKYYMNERDAPSFFIGGTLATWPLYTLTYHNDSSITFKDIHREFTYNKDSTVVSGTYKIGIYTRKECALELKCMKMKDEFNCEISNKGKRILFFDYSGLDYYLTRIELGEYDRLIYNSHSTKD